MNFIDMEKITTLQVRDTWYQGPDLTKNRTHQAGE